MEQPDRTYDVEFGYVNSTGATQTIALGADNHFTPANTFNHRNPPTTFAPGTVTKAVFVSNIPKSVPLAWSITYEGQTSTVVATPDLPHCPKQGGGSGGSTTTPPPAPTLAVSAWATVRKAHIGRTFVYGVRVRNTSGVAATNVNLTDTVSRKVTIIGLQPQSTACTRAGRATSCSLASIPAHTGVRLAFKVRATQRGRAVNLVHVAVPQQSVLTARASVSIVSKLH
jgi:uncharacterized repeat protein (TIGR01451 family)